MIGKLEKMVRDLKGNDNITLSEDMSLVADLGLNSLDLVNLACSIEDELDIEIPDRAIKELKTVGDVIRVIGELK